MMRKIPLFLFLLLCACGGGNDSPEPFARDVVAAIAAGDFGGYWALSAQNMNALAESDDLVPGQGLGASLASQEQQAARADFDRVVRSGRLRAGDEQRLDPVVTATEPGRWTLELFDPDGRGVGVQIAVRSWEDGYRLLRAYPVEPGRDRAMLVVLER